MVEQKSYQTICVEHKNDAATLFKVIFVTPGSKNTPVPKLLIKMKLSILDEKKPTKRLKKKIWPKVVKTRSIDDI